MKSYHTNLVIAILLLCVGVLFLTIGCSDKLIGESHSTDVKIAIDTDGAFYKSAAVEVFGVIVTDPETGKEIVPAELLILNGAYLEGTIDSLPANVLLRFTVQALDAQGVLIYSGSVIRSIVADQVNLIEVQLRPVVPMMKLSPRYYSFILDPNFVEEVFYVDVKVFNIDSLYGTSFILTPHESFCWIDSAVLSPRLAAEDVLFNAGWGDMGYTASVTHTNRTRTLVDANGDGVLARFYCRTTRHPDSGPGSSYIDLQVTGVTKVDDGYISIESIYTDNTLLEFGWPTEWQ